MIETILIVFLAGALGVVVLAFAGTLLLGLLRLAVEAVAFLGRVIMPRNPHRGAEVVAGGLACALVLWWLV